MLVECVYLLFALMRGRELKSERYLSEIEDIEFALMRGRELKYGMAQIVEANIRSPSCEGGS